jgi:hypothetical protein
LTASGDGGVVANWVFNQTADSVKATSSSPVAVSGERSTGFQYLTEVCRVVTAIWAAPGWQMTTDDPLGRGNLEIAAWLVNDRGDILPVPVGHEPDAPWLQATTGGEREDWTIVPPTNETSD